MKKIGKTTNLFGYEIVSISYSSLLKKLKQHLVKKNDLLTIFTPNPEQLVVAKKNKSFAKTLGMADVLLPDGVGLLLASHGQIPERITGLDVAQDLLNFAVSKQLKVLIIGGRGYLGLSYQSLEVKDAKKQSSGSGVYWLEGYKDVYLPTDIEEIKVDRVVKKLRPDIIFVAFGVVAQEEWVLRKKDLLGNTGVSLVMVVGGAFDVLLGKILRASKWMRWLGLEWLYRLFKEPWRWRRQLRLLEFMGMVITKKL